MSSACVCNLSTLSPLLVDANEVAKAQIPFLFVHITFYFIADITAAVPLCRQFCCLFTLWKKKYLGGGVIDYVMLWLGKWRWWWRCFDWRDYCFNSWSVRTSCLRVGLGPLISSTVDTLIESKLFSFSRFFAIRLRMTPPLLSRSLAATLSSAVIITNRYKFKGVYTRELKSIQSSPKQSLGCKKSERIFFNFFLGVACKLRNTQVAAENFFPVTCRTSVLVSKEPEPHTD